MQSLLSAQGQGSCLPIYRILQLHGRSQIQLLPTYFLDIHCSLSLKPFACHAPPSLSLLLSLTRRDRPPATGHMLTVLILVGFPTAGFTAWESSLSVPSHYWRPSTDQRVPCDTICSLCCANSSAHCLRTVCIPDRPDPGDAAKQIRQPS